MSKNLQIQVHLQWYILFWKQSKTHSCISVEMCSLENTELGMAEGAMQSVNGHDSNTSVDFCMLHEELVYQIL